MVGNIMLFFSHECGHFDYKTEWNRMLQSRWLNGMRWVKIVHADPCPPFPTRWCPLVINWFRNPIIYRYFTHKPYSSWNILELYTKLVILGAPHCTFPTSAPLFWTNILARCSAIVTESRVMHMAARRDQGCYLGETSKACWWFGRYEWFSFFGEQ